MQVLLLLLVRLLVALLGDVHAIILENLLVHLIYPSLSWLDNTSERLACLILLLVALGRRDPIGRGLAPAPNLVSHKTFGTPELLVDVIVRLMREGMLLLEATVSS